MYVIRAVPKRARRSGLGDVIKIASDSGKLDVPAPPVFYENGKQLPFGVLPGTTTPEAVNRRLTTILQTFPAAPVRVTYAPPAPAAPAEPGTLAQLGKWLGEEVVSGTGISKGLALSGAGLLVIMAASKRGGRRR